MKASEIRAMTPKQKLNLLRMLVRESDIVVTACYGEAEPISSNQITLAKDDEIMGRFWPAKGGKTIFINTSIMTG